VFYPHPGSLSWGRIAGATAVLAAGTALALATIRRRPWLAVGWAWYLGTLVPVIGLVQIGLQARADRYTYLPLTGVFVAAGWEFAHWASRGGGGRKGSAGKARAPMLALAIVLVAACAAQSRRQVMYWRDSLTLFRHAIEIAADNYVAHNNLGGALEKRGRYAEAAEHYRESLRLRGDAMAHYNLGGALAKMGRLDDAIGHWQEAIRLTPGFAKAYYNLGLAWELKGNPDLAAACYRTALKYDPLFVDASGNLGRILGRAGRLTEAEDCLRQAIRLAPGSAPAHVNLGNVLVMRGKTGEAAGHYREALRLDASLVPVRVELAWILASDPDAQNRNGAEAMRLAEAACPRGSEAPPRHLDVLAAAYAEAGRFALAVRAAEEARTRAAAAGQTNLAAAISARLDLYRAGSPFRWSDESNRSM
jgi:tetratricopeptide (TPR) repeat protein